MYVCILYMYVFDTISSYFGVFLSLCVCTFQIFLIFLFQLHSVHAGLPFLVYLMFELVKVFCNQEDGFGGGVKILKSS